MSDVDVKQLLMDFDGLLNGHFCLTSGLHSDTYFQCAKLYQYPDIVEKIGKKHEQAGIENPRFLPFEPGKENHQKGIQARQEYGNDSRLPRREGSHQRTLRLFPVQDIQPADESQQHDRVHRKGKNPRVGIAEKKLEESRRQKYEDKQV